MRQALTYNTDTLDLSPKKKRISKTGGLPSSFTLWFPELDIQDCVATVGRMSAICTSRCDRHPPTAYWRVFSLHLSVKHHQAVSGMANCIHPQLPYLRRTVDETAEGLGLEMHGLNSHWQSCTISEGAFTLPTSASANARNTWHPRACM